MLPPFPLDLVAPAAASLGALLLDAAPAARRRAAVGLTLVLFARAALHVGGGAAGVALARSGPTSGDEIFLALSGGVGLLGVVVLLAALATAGARWRAGPILLALGTAGITAVGLPIWYAAGPGRTVGSAAALATAAFLLYRLGKLARAAMPARLRVGCAETRSGAAAALRAAGPLATVGLPLAVLLVLAAPHLWVLLGAALCAAAIADWASIRSAGARRIPGRFLLALTLVPFGWLATAIAGPVGVSLAALPDAPFSPAAESLLAVPLALGACAFLGLWPIPADAIGALLAPVGGALLLRVGAAAFPEGMAHLQPLAFLLLALSAWRAAVRNRRDLALAAVGGMGACVGAAVGAALLLVGAAVVALWPAPARTRWIRTAWLLPAAGALLVLEPALRAEVTWTVVAVAAVLVALAAPASAEPAGP